MKTYLVLNDYCTLIGTVQAKDFHAARRLALSIYRLGFGAGIVIEKGERL